MLRFDDCACTVIVTASRAMMVMIDFIIGFLFYVILIFWVRSECNVRVLS
jgi:hypothetical protein